VGDKPQGFDRGRCGSELELLLAKEPLDGGQNIGLIVDEQELGFFRILILDSLGIHASSFN
jgi:hypothetical protein